MKIVLNFDSFRVAILIDFGSQMGTLQLWSGTSFSVLKSLFLLHVVLFASKKLQDVPKRPQDPPKGAQRGSKRPPRAPRRLPEGLKRPQPRGPKTSQDLSHLTFSMFPSKSPNFLLCLTYSPNFFIGHLTQELVNRPLQLQRCRAKMPCHRTRTGMPKAGGRAAVSPQRGRQ